MLGLIKTRFFNGSGLGSPLIWYGSGIWGSVKIQWIHPGQSQRILLVRIFFAELIECIVIMTSMLSIPAGISFARRLLKFIHIWPYSTCIGDHLVYPCVACMGLATNFSQSEQLQRGNTNTCGNLKCHYIMTTQL